MSAYVLNACPSDGMSIAPRERAYTLTVKKVLRLRAVQEQYRRIADCGDIKASAREAARREIARIEGEIRG
jgi:hypothetical protein